MQNEKAEATVTLDKQVSETTSKATTKSDKKTKLRAFPLWLRVIVFIVVLVLVIFIGLFIGYSMLGGGEAADVFKLGTWEHILDIMNGKE